MLYPKSYGTDPMFPQSSDFEVVQKDENSGKGVICYRSFNKGDVIAHVTGEMISEIRQHTLQVSPELHMYDPHFTGYFLHSCDPNIFLDMENFKVTAIKDIPVNSYLYMDYSTTEDYLFKQFPCSCGAKNCRGWITGKKEKMPLASSSAMNVVHK